jgi:hypothetical protein
LPIWLNHIFTLIMSVTVGTYCFSPDDGESMFFQNVAPHSWYTVSQLRILHSEQVVLCCSYT